MILGGTILGFDYVGAATLVAAFTGLVTSVGVIVAQFRGTRIEKTTKDIHQATLTGNGRTIGEAVAATADTVGVPHIDPVDPPAPEDEKKAS